MRGGGGLRLLDLALQKITISKGGGSGKEFEIYITSNYSQNFLICCFFFQVEQAERKKEEKVFTSKVFLTSNHFSHFILIYKKNVHFGANKKERL